ncbi:MAG: hypothetical protein L0Z62_20200 [Gemmataceae bacterium]|nr:hypothetical protein [Gemmataceae bacterium]
MARKQQPERDDDQAAQTRQRQGAVISQHVLSALGQPDDLHGVDVRQLWPGRCRVNVLVGMDAASARIAHSFFLVLDDDGLVVASTPEITREY